MRKMKRRQWKDLSLFTSNLTFFMMEMKASKTTSWDAVHTPPWEQQRKDESPLDLKG
jgi:hypothetical protein